jgi:hypothetical protein
MYTSDLTRLLGMLRETQANGVIYTKWAGSGEPWQAHLTLFEGQVITCHIQSSVDGQRLLTDGEALGWLASLGTLTWEREASPLRQAPLSLPGDSQTDFLQPFEVPRRLVQGEQGGMHAWSRKQRQVFALVDGRRSIERIAVILCQPLNVVKEIVHDLRARGVLAVDLQPVS